jgi:DNA polymerase
MSDIPLTPEKLEHQAAQHLESLRQAGVEWLPAAPAMEFALAGSDSEAVPAAARRTEESTLTTRRKELQMLEKKVSTCTRCAELASTRTQTVFGVGPLDAELCFIGEAPGADEDAQGKPFVGAAGQLLNKIIEACGLKREEVYICNIIKCRPPGNRTPKPDEAAHCREYLDAQLELMRPRFICALGGCAAQNLLGTNQPMGKLRGYFHEYKGIPVLCTYHPAYLLPHRNPAKKQDVWEDMKMLLKRMGREIPKRGQG